MDDQMIGSDVLQAPTGGSPQGGPVRLAVIDSDSGFERVLTKRMAAMGWQYRTLASPVPPDDLVAMRINCLVVDLALLGPQAWDFLERVCDDVPGLGVIVCTQHSAVAQRGSGVRLRAGGAAGTARHAEGGRERAG